MDNDSPLKSQVMFEKDDALLQSPRVFFSDHMASPRARKEKEQNDSFQLPLSVRAGGVVAAEQRGVKIARAYACLGVVLVFFVILYSLETREWVREKLWVLICFCGTLFIVLLQVVWVLLVWSWVRAGRKHAYERLDTIPPA